MTGISYTVYLFMAITIYVVIAFFYFIFFKQSPFTVEGLEKRCSSPLISRSMAAFWFWLFDPLFKILMALNISPNLITFLSVPVTACSAILYAYGNILWGSWVLVLAATMDMLDGRLARERNKVSKSGEFLDSSVDRISDGMIFVALLFYFRSNIYMFFTVSIVLISSYSISYFRAKAEALYVKNEVGMMQRPERLWILCLSGILSSFIKNLFNLSVTSSGEYFLFDIALVFMAFSTFMSALLRLSNGFFLLRDRDKAHFKKDHLVIIDEGKKEKTF